MGNRKQRLERLEGGRRGRGIRVINVKPGETKTEARQRHMAEHPEREKAKFVLDDLLFIGHLTFPPDFEMFNLPEMSD